jgi:hypothetical protein
MIRARILTQWTGTGTNADPYRPKINDDFGLATVHDATGQDSKTMVPSPNLFTAEITATEAVFNQILASPNYGQASVLWQESF